jgi:predicted acylesterase/phospholipase RssA
VGDEIPSGERIRALSFNGGGFDTVMQLGVAHALLVSNGQPPDYVVGISAGAINAAALAEVLQSGEGLPEEQRRAAQVRRLREFINSYVEVPQEIVNSTLPDTFEINAQKALHPIELPVHFQEERKSRDDANRSRAGLIHLLNHLLQIRLTVAAATRIVRRLLAVAESGEKRRPKRVRDTRLWNYAGLWLAAGLHSRALSRVFFSMLWATAIGPRRTNERRTAGEIILAAHLLRSVLQVARNAAIWLLFLAIWATPLAVVLSPEPPWMKDPATIVLPRIPEAPAEAVAPRATDLVKWTAIPFGRVIPDLVKETVHDLFTLARTAWDFVVQGAVSVYHEYWGEFLLLAVFWLAALLLEMTLDWRSRYVLLAYLLVRFSDARLPLVVGAALIVLLVMKLWPKGADPTTRYLEYYQNGDGLLSSDVLKQELIKRFNRDYYGRPALNQMIDTALGRGRSVNLGNDRHRKTIGDYAKHDPPIHVAPVAADLSRGVLQVLPANTAVVDGLLAATAVAPLFPAHNPTAEPPEPPQGTWARILSTFHFLHGDTKKDPVWYIDGLNVSNEPIQPLLDHMRDDFDALRKRDATQISDPDKKRLLKMRQAKTVDIYSISDLPIDHAELEGHGDYSTLVEVGLRGMELREFRDATMERRLTRLYTKALPVGEGAFLPLPFRTMIHANVFPVELDRPARVNRRIARGANTDEIRRVLHEAVADGCRAALDAMIPATILERKTFEEWLQTQLNETELKDLGTVVEAQSHLLRALRTAQAIEGGDKIELRGLPPQRLGIIPLSKDAFEELVNILAPRCVEVILNNVKRMLPGAEMEYGPGVPEVCRNCRLYRPGDEADTLVPTEEERATAQAQRPPFDDRGRLRAHADRAEGWPQWPSPEVQTVRGPAVAAPVWTKTDRTPDWSGFPDFVDRPTISFLFGGGVFRGVFHMGVMNALDEVRLEPDIVAGSSVGSIIAAMVASVFKTTDDVTRKKRIRELAATFLSIDRFVLTDRLSDFVRRLTLRAAEAQFSPRDLDLLLRRYDLDLPSAFNQRMRKALAGLERLLYLSPFELHAIIRAARLRKPAAVVSEVVGDIQELLERGGVGLEILGSEPLSLLIKLHVEDSLRELTGEEGEARFDSFLLGDKPIYFMATTTNLIRGSLEILNSPYRELRNVSLAYGLLASSAFPAVFRPRQSWEIFLGTSSENQKYVDGGVIDNLPLDAVARVLDNASRPDDYHRALVTPRPPAPHLLFTASLEVDRDILPMQITDVKNASRNFMKVSRRAKTFQHNRKIDAYRAVQDRLNEIFEYYAKRKPTDPRNRWTPLKLAVVTVKPKWLCGTFGFHPMLGFRRRKQAQSIAHGCASTLAYLDEATSGVHAARRAAWKMQRVDIDPGSVVKTEIPGTSTRRMDLEPQTNKKEGDCWFRTAGHVCPFSRQWRLAQTGRTADERIRPEELKELHRIYVECGRIETHQPES